MEQFASHSKDQCSRAKRFHTDASHSRSISFAESTDVRKNSMFSLLPLIIYWLWLYLTNVANCHKSIADELRFTDSENDSSSDIPLDQDSQ